MGRKRAAPEPIEVTVEPTIVRLRVSVSGSLRTRIKALAAAMSLEMGEVVTHLATTSDTIDTLEDQHLGKKK